MTTRRKKKEVTAIVPVETGSKLFHPVVVKEEGRRSVGIVGIETTKTETKRTQTKSVLTLKNKPTEGELGQIVGCAEELFGTIDETARKAKESPKKGGG